MASKLLTKSNISRQQKRNIDAGKRIVGLLRKSDDAADFSARRTAEQSLADVLTQTGEGAGKRIKGAASHEFADQMIALAAIVDAGNEPRFE